jgi:transcriptional regulator with XRE-family HTH domain
MNYIQIAIWQDDPMKNASKSVAAILNELEDGNRSAMSRKTGHAQPVISRIVAGKVVPSLDVLEAIAHSYEFEVWQLLVKDFDPKHPPVLRYMSTAEEALYLKFKELRSSMAEIPFD